ncbi:hypothetical protein SLEP1_g53462 [Rubroshorea leprosula]|uniref:Uncharacterized protein n=1 Tax=Rubroshorea leprosula TaxID=152421 RepID=A0AAV5MC99_9ROSI|nr:hypothetical protein SLEP1_g53462 [Rubroshorea leprosula]
MPFVAFYQPICHTQNSNPRRDRHRTLVRRVPQVHKARNLFKSQTNTIKI